MRVYIATDNLGRIVAYDTITPILGGIDIDVPDTAKTLDGAYYIDGQLILPPDPPEPQPDPTARIAELEQQVADLTAAIERGISL